MAKAAKATKEAAATKATKKKAASAGKDKGKGNTTSNGGGGGNKKKEGGGSKKSGAISKAIMKKIDAWWDKNRDALVKYAVDEYNWEEDTAKDTVVAYQQYLIVEREMKGGGMS